MTIVTSLLTFPNIGWWMQVTGAQKVLFDKAEHFEKMTYRNRYRISGANNSILLTVPLVNGRNQHIPMQDVKIFNESRWQTQHWRTLVSVYKRTPYFDHYEEGLRPLFENQYTYLTDFNRATIDWACKQMKVNFEIQETDVYIKEYPTGIIDLRSVKKAVTDFPKYYQVFEERNGFVPDLSILDLLFSEGPGAGVKLIG